MIFSVKKLNILLVQRYIISTFIVKNRNIYKYNELSKLEPKMLTKMIDNGKIISDNYYKFISKVYLSKSLETIKNQDIKSK